jgi:hypothetical protein
MISLNKYEWSFFLGSLPLMLEAAAQCTDFWHSINKIKEKKELELALTNPPVVIPVIWG